MNQPDTNGSNKSTFVECTEQCVPCSCDLKDDSYIEWNIIGRKYSFRRLDLITRWGLFYGTLNTSRFLNQCHRPTLITPEMEKIEYFKHALYGLPDEDEVKENMKKARAYEKEELKKNAANQLAFANKVWEKALAEGYVTGELVIPSAIPLDSDDFETDDESTAEPTDDFSSPLMVNKLSDQELTLEIHKVFDIIVAFLNYPFGKYIPNKVTLVNSNYKIVYHLCNYFNVCIEESINQIIQLQNATSQSTENTDNFFWFSVDSGQYRLIATAFQRGTNRSLNIRPHNLQPVQLIKYMYEELWFVQYKFDNEFCDILKRYGRKHVNQIYYELLDERKTLDSKKIKTPEMITRIDEIEQIVNYAFMNEIKPIIDGVIAMNSENHQMIITGPGTKIEYSTPKKIKTIKFYTSLNTPCLLRMDINFYDTPETQTIGELPKEKGKSGQEQYTTSTIGFEIDEQINKIDVGQSGNVIVAMKFYSNISEKMYGCMDNIDKKIEEQLPTYAKIVGNRWNHGTFDIAKTETIMYSYLQGFNNQYRIQIPHQLVVSREKDQIMIPEPYELQAARASLNGVAGCEAITNYHGRVQPIKAISTIFFEWKHTLHVPKLYDPSSDDPEIINRTDMISIFKSMSYDF